MPRTLPFKVSPVPSVERVDIEAGGYVISLEKHGSISVSEEIACADAMLGVSTGASLSELKARVVTAFLPTRVDPEWKFEDTLGLPSFDIVEKLYDFFMNERAGWQAVETEGDGNQKKGLTGPVSTGDSDSPIQMTIDSALTTSGTSPSP